jgi:hypothetical protein
LDVDGAEGKILEGAQRMLAQWQPLIVMEVVVLHFRDPLKNPILILQKLGYHFYDVKTGRSYSGVEEVRKALPEVDEEMATSINIVAVLSSARAENLWDVSIPRNIDRNSSTTKTNC